MAGIPSTFFCLIFLSATVLHTSGFPTVHVIPVPDEVNQVAVQWSVAHKLFRVFLLKLVEGRASHMLIPLNKGHGIDNQNSGFCCQRQGGCFCPDIANAGSDCCQVVCFVALAHGEPLIKIVIWLKQ